MCVDVWKMCHEFKGLSGSSSEANTAREEEEVEVMVYESVSKSEEKKVPWASRLRVGLLVAALLCGGGMTLVHVEQVQAQSAPQEARQSLGNEQFDVSLQQGNKAYNDEKYERALELYAEAIQLLPMRPEPYKNMARAYFWSGQYNAALAYYDTYLTTFPEAADREQIERERRLTSDRTSKPWSLPEAQRSAMRSLEAALAGEEMYARGGAGAWQSYQALLRTGYAQPALGKLRERLLVNLLREHDAQLVTGEGQTAPDLDEQDWTLQQERMTAARKLAMYQDDLEEIERREKIHKAARALLLARYEEAAALSEQAIEANPEALYVRWFFITALMRANKAKQALRELDELEALFRDRGISQLDDITHVVRAMLLQRMDRHDEAAKLYKDIFLQD